MTKAIPQTALKRAREAAGLTQVDLARAIGITGDRFCKIEKGRRRLGLVEFIRLIDALNLTAARAVRLARELAGEPNTDAEDEDLVEDPRAEILTPRPLPGAA